MGQYFCKQVHFFQREKKVGYRVAGLSNRQGIVIGKRKRFGLFGRQKHYISVQFDLEFDLYGHNICEYNVGADLCDEVIIGASVKGQFEQIPEGLYPLFLF